MAVRNGIGYRQVRTERPGRVLFANPTARAGTRSIHLRSFHSLESPRLELDVHHGAAIWILRKTAAPRQRRMPETTCHSSLPSTVFSGSIRQPSTASCRRSIDESTHRTVEQAATSRSMESPSRTPQGLVPTFSRVTSLFCSETIPFDRPSGSTDPLSNRRSHRCPRGVRNQGPPMGLEV